MKRVRFTAFVIGSIASLAVAGAHPARAARATAGRTTVQVFAAASLSEAFTEMARALEAQRPDVIVRLSFAGSQQLATQIDQGATADVFASADERWMFYARDHRLLAGDAATFVKNRLVVIVPSANPARIRRLQDLTRGGTKLVIGADAVPVGRYCRIMLQNLSREPAFGGDFMTRTLHNVVSEEENVKSVVGKVQLGEADAGIVYRSDVTAAVARFVHIIEIPDGANVLASYSIAPVAGGKEPAAGKAFIDFVLSPRGQASLERRGLIPVLPTKP
jgi:molybdate transport system substrate-binding protein